MSPFSQRHLIAITQYIRCGHITHLGAPLLSSVLPISFVTVCGLWGLSGSLCWSYAKTRRAMITVLLCTQPGYIAHWALRGDWTAVGMSAISLILTLLSSGLDAPEGSARLVWTRRAFVLALLPLAVVTVLSWHGRSSLFAAVGMTMGCVARWQTDGARFRALMLGSSLPWLAHDLMAMSAPAVCADAVGLGRAAYIAISRTRLRAQVQARLALDAETVQAAHLADTAATA